MQWVLKTKDLPIAGKCDSFSSLSIAKAFPVFESYFTNERVF